MQTVKAIDDITAALRTSIANWERQIAAKREDFVQLEHERAGWRKKVIRDGDASSQGNLDALRSVTAFLIQEIEDYETELKRAEAELEMLVAARVEAVKAEAWDKWMVEAEEVVKEAKAIERFWDQFIDLLTPHKQRLERMAGLAKDAGHERGNIDTKHLWRRLEAKLRAYDPWAGWAKQPREYSEQPYPKILKHVLDVADAQYRGPEKSKAANE